MSFLELRLLRDVVMAITLDASRMLFGFLCTGMAPEETRINRKMGFLNKFALAQKLICRLWGTVAAGSQCQPLVGACTRGESLLTEGGNVYQLVVMIGASKRDGICRVRRLERERGVGGELTLSEVRPEARSLHLVHKHRNRR